MEGGRRREGGIKKGRIKGENGEKKKRERGNDESKRARARKKQAREEKRREYAQKNAHGRIWLYKFSLSRKWAVKRYCE